MQNIYYQLKDADMLVIASPIYYHGLSGKLKCTIDRFYAAAYPNKPPKLRKVAMFLSSGDPGFWCRSEITGTHILKSERKGWQTWIIRISMLRR